MRSYKYHANTPQCYVSTTPLVLFKSSSRHCRKHWSPHILIWEPSGDRLTRLRICVVLFSETLCFKPCSFGVEKAHYSQRSFYCSYLIKFDNPEVLNYEVVGHERIDICLKVLNKNHENPTFNIADFRGKILIRDL